MEIKEILISVSQPMRQDSNGKWIRVDGWIDGRKDGWIDGWMDGYDG
jgi:hypothetical protein